MKSSEVNKLRVYLRTLNAGLSKVASYAALRNRYVNFGDNVKLRVSETAFMDKVIKISADWIGSIVNEAESINEQLTQDEIIKKFKDCFNAVVGAKEFFLNVITGASRPVIKNPEFNSQFASLAKNLGGLLSKISKDVAALDISVNPHKTEKINDSKFDKFFKESSREIKIPQFGIR